MKIEVGDRIVVTFSPWFASHAGQDHVKAVVTEVSGDAFAWEGKLEDGETISGADNVSNEGRDWKRDVSN